MIMVKKHEITRIYKVAKFEISTKIIHKSIVKCAKMQTQSHKLWSKPIIFHALLDMWTLDTHSLLDLIQKEHPIFCSAVFSACLLHSPPEPCSHAESISLIQSIGIPLLLLSIAINFPYFSPSWSPRCSHWYATSASATINKRRVSISVSEWNHCTP